MDLFYRKLGQGEPVIILHGLYGSSDNWYSIGRELSSSHTVYLIDQRNHGHSPHHPDHNYDVLSDDLYGFTQKHGLASANIIGHSMGGKTALAFGLKHPEKVKKMVIVDISPFDYERDSISAETEQHTIIIHALQSIDPEHITSREEADGLLKSLIPSEPLRQFLLKNLKRTSGGRYDWTLNIKALADNMNSISAGIIHNPISPALFPILFIKGGLSPYIGRNEEVIIHKVFPWAQIITIPGASHWVHAEQPRLFMKAVSRFI
jgi:esterase